MNWRPVVLILFALFGAFLMQDGSITAQVISESCCMGEDCNPENQCPSSEAAKNDDPIFLFVLGTSVFIVSMFLIFLELKKKVKYEKENPNL
ncbi:hypothetical protein CMO92_00300 [Candidatus Woesearchaeota archaeon]|nr:hypothetical protein [Candidatus Woesearchaeota archaeon]|tara:strand:- start:77 stop:352 length:276 start_codon:yes stop_codon:yes gene_type:complete